MRKKEAEMNILILTVVMLHRGVKGDASLLLNLLYLGNFSLK